MMLRAKNRRRNLDEVKARPLTNDPRFDAAHNKEVREIEQEIARLEAYGRFALSTPSLMAYHPDDKGGYYVHEFNDLHQRSRAVGRFVTLGDDNKPLDGASSTADFRNDELDLAVPEGRLG